MNVAIGAPFIHGALLFSWTLFYFMQTAWVACGHTPIHRAWGLAEIALFSVMMCLILVTKIIVMRLDDAHGYGAAGRRFAAVPLFALPVLIGLAGRKGSAPHVRWQDA
jgi:hypothetical protein